MSEEQIRNIKVEYNNVKNAIMKKIHETKDDNELMELLTSLQNLKVQYEKLLGKDAYVVEDTEEIVECNMTMEEIRNRKVELSNRQNELNQQITQAQNDMDYMTLRGELQRIRKEYSDLNRMEQFLVTKNPTGIEQEEAKLRK